jgi:hypothetical protein
MNLNLSTKQKVIVGGLVVAGFLAAPVIFMTIKGLIGLAIAAVVSIAIVAMAPFVVQFFGNLRIKAMKGEAARNPIPDLTQLYEKSVNALKQFAEQLKIFKGEVDFFETKVKEAKKLYPEESAVFEEQLGAMRELERYREHKFQEARADVEEMRKELEKAEVIWNLGMAAERMNKAAGDIEGETIDKIRRNTALESVQKKLIHSMNEIEVAMLEEKNKTYQPIRRVKAISEPVEVKQS